MFRCCELIDGRVSFTRSASNRSRPKPGRVEPPAVGPGDTLANVRTGSAVRRARAAGNRRIAGRELGVELVGLGQPRRHHPGELRPKRRTGRTMLRTVPTAMEKKSMKNPMLIHSISTRLL